MKAAIMQPYFFPYIGYFQLIRSVDLFIVYDNIKYTKKGWINRNRILQNGKDATFSLPLKQGSDHLDIRDRELAIDFSADQLLKKITGAYRKAPFFVQTFKLIENILQNKNQNLFQFIHESIIKTCAHLEIQTEIRVSSEIETLPDLKHQKRVIALCKTVNATTYINAIGGLDLYSKEEFKDQGVELKFIRSLPFQYPQFDATFVPWLSIIDVMMFNSPETIQKYLHEGYELI